MKNYTLPDGRKTRGLEYCSKKCPHFISYPAKFDGVCIRAAPVSLDHDLGPIFAAVNSPASLKILWLRDEECLKDADD